jgi:hypothetical protein
VEGRAALPPGGSEAISVATAAAERAILALRLDRGVGAVWAAESAASEAFIWARQAGLVEDFDLEGEARVRLTLRGRLLSNELFERLL